MKRRTLMPALIAADVVLVQGELDKLLAVYRLLGDTANDVGAGDPLHTIRAAREATIAKLTAAGAEIHCGNGVSIHFRDKFGKSSLGISGALEAWIRDATEGAAA